MSDTRLSEEILYVVLAGLAYLRFLSMAFIIIGVWEEVIG